MTKISRRHFLAATGVMTGSALLSPLSGIKAETIGISTPIVKKTRIALIGTGSRGIFMWGRDLMRSIPIISNS